jgi:ribosome modulation factor
MEPRVLPFATIDAAETEGVDAFCFGMGQAACPYPARTEAGKAWLRGWNDAAKIDKEEKADHRGWSIWRPHSCGGAAEGKHLVSG